MYRRLIFLASLFLTLASSVEASPKVVQALVVDFPVNGRVIVQAREEVGNFPEMLFVSEKSGKVLLRHSIKDKDKWLIPDDNKEIKQPVLRFRVIRSRGFATPLIASVGAWYGTSDNAFYLTAFGEIQGQIKILMPMPVCANIQGGYYLGYLSTGQKSFFESHQAA